MTTVRRAFLDSTLLRWYVTGEGVPEDVHRQELAEALHVAPARLSFETREVEDGEYLAKVIDVIQSDGQPLPPPPPTIEQQRKDALDTLIGVLAAAGADATLPRPLRQVCGALGAWLRV
jgi:hypothetical protein